MKLFYYRLQFELTRRCNQECAHCCRGDAQNLDLTEDIVDAFFENNDIQYIDTFMVSGGEPMLNGKILEYIVDKIIEKNIGVGMFMLGINGLAYSEEFIKGLNKLREYIIAKSGGKIKHAGLLMVSQDQYHKEADPIVVERLKELPYLSPIVKTESKREDLLPYGRAYKNGLSIKTPDLESINKKKYKVKEREGENYLVIDYQYIASNGNVVNDGGLSYDLMDEYALGNVKEQKIVDMYLTDKEKRLLMTA